MRLSSRCAAARRRAVHPRRVPLGARVRAHAASLLERVEDLPLLCDCDGERVATGACSC